jgi:molybdopterin-guanine dinucleotide biosynthesis protein A
MGRPKALLPVGRSTLIEWMVEKLAPGFDQLLVSARDELQLPEGLRAHLVCDLHPGAGPLAGIEAGLAASRRPALVAVACDMPAVGVELAQRLVAASEGHDAAVPRVGGRPEPTCAAYRRSARPPITELLEAGSRRVAAALRELDVAWLDGEEPRQFADLDTPDDYARFLDALRK